MGLFFIPSKRVPVIDPAHSQASGLLEVEGDHISESVVINSRDENSCLDNS